MTLTLSLYKPEPCPSIPLSQVLCTPNPVSLVFVSRRGRLSRPPAAAGTAARPKSFDDGGHVPVMVGPNKN